VNTRIHELVDSTAEATPGVYTLSYESGGKGVEFTEVALKHFVELIVAECEQVALRHSHRSDDMGAIIAKQINKHFGVTS
jgi:hypothetical protein